MGVDSINAGGETPVTLKKEEQTPARKIRAGVPIFPRIYLLFVFILCNPLILCSHQKNSLSSLGDCDIIIRHLGADGCWCALWSSKPVIVVSSCIGGFNSHTFPPKAHSCWNELFLLNLSVFGSRMKAKIFYGGFAMKRVLITGGTVFVSRFAATWFAENGYEVFVLNRGNHLQPENTTLIQADRHQLGDRLKHLSFDAVLDITAYDAQDVHDLLNALGSFDDYILISSSAVYPENLSQPFVETQPVGPNTIWGKYGTDKIAAEQELLKSVPNAYILRPPYLYGPMQNLYREPFVFDCAVQGRPFYIPGDGKMPLQFFHVEDLCRFIHLILQNHPSDHIFNVGNRETVDINTFVKLCYEAANCPLFVHHVFSHPNQRDYFPFHNYSYVLDTTRQNKLLVQQKDLLQGLKESFLWYQSHPEDAPKRGYLAFIDQNFQ